MSCSTANLWLSISTNLTSALPGRAGGNAHLRRRQRDVKRRPDKAAENDRSQDGYEPGVAEERPDPVPHGVSKRFEAHCGSQWVRRRGGGTLRLFVPSKPLPQPQLHGERRTMRGSGGHGQILNTRIIAAGSVGCVKIASLIAERAKIWSGIWRHVQRAGVSALRPVDGPQGPKRTPLGSA